MPKLDLRINEVASQNERVWLDELGEMDDYVELFTPTAAAIDLGAAGASGELYGISPSLR